MIEASATDILDACRDASPMDEARIDEEMNRLISGFSGETLMAEVVPRLGDLSEPYAEILLRLIEVHGTPDALAALAKAIRDRPDLPPERAWMALNLLAGTNLLENDPALIERWEELAELIEDESSLDELAAQIEEDADGPWVALQGLAAIEPEVRVEIVKGLGRQPSGPGLMTFLRHLAVSHDPDVRESAIKALEARSSDDPYANSAWRSLAEVSFEPTVQARARAWLGQEASRDVVPIGSARRGGPRLVRSLVSGVDHEGRGDLMLVAEDRGEWVAVAFECDVLTGIRAANGVIGDRSDAGDDLFRDIQQLPDVVENAHELTLSLLAGSLMISGRDAPPVLPYWIERTVGPGFRPDSFTNLLPDFDYKALPFEEMTARVAELFSVCKRWREDSPLIRRIADELRSRGALEDLDHQRESGVFRLVFDACIQGKLELYRRMLLWSAAVWGTSGSEDLARTALALSWQLADPQHAVPGHPFIAALIETSLRSS